MLILSIVTISLLVSQNVDGVPYDGVPMESIVSLHVSLTVIFSVLATCGIVFALVCITLNTHFRDKK